MKYEVLSYSLFKDMGTDTRTVGGRVKHFLPLFDFLFLISTRSTDTSILIPIFPAFLLLYSSLFFPVAVSRHIFCSANRSRRQSSDEHDDENQLDVPHSLRFPFRGAG